MHFNHLLHSLRVFGCSLFGLTLVAILSTHPLQAADTADAKSGLVVINEIHYNPALKTEGVEFIELYNRSAYEVDLSYWTLGEGVGFFFEPGNKLPPNGFLIIAQNPAAVTARYGVPVVGAYTGRLNAEGDEIVLRDNNAEEVDRVVYGLGFPWPIVGDEPSRSIELINPDLDNNRGSAWRAGEPTPLRVNSTLTANPPPAIETVSHAPGAPTTADPVQITASVTDADGVAEVQLWVQVVAPGAYIARHDPAYAEQWTPLPMVKVGGDLYTTELPPEMRQYRHLVRYRISARDGAGQEIVVPTPDDPQPNFALFIYDSPPPWRGAIRPGQPGPQGEMLTYDFSAMRPLPVYHFLAKRSDVEDAQFIPNSKRNVGYPGDDYPWLGTLVYNGQVYDHIGFRARGGFHRYSVGKNMWKFNFNRGHRFQAYDNYGRPYPTQWDKLNFSATIQHASRGNRGEHGLYEALSFKLFELAGVAASHTHYVHFRVIDSANEAGANQYGGDFWGLYLAIEEVDGLFLDARSLPDGNLYKMENWTGELNNQGPNDPIDKSDLNAFIHRYSQTNPDEVWWRQNLDLPSYYSYRAILEALHHYDVDQGKNYLYYRDPERGLWSVLPWDLDLTWAEKFTGTGVEPFFVPVLSKPSFQIEYQNRLREVRDLLFNPDQIYPLIGEYAALINTPADGLSMLDADRAKWDYNPILVSSYVLPERGAHGKFYARSPSNDFRGMLQLMREWVVARSAWIDRELLTDALIPATPIIAYTGSAGYPADGLRFQSSEFIDANAGFAALQWRAAEIAWPGLPGYTPNTPNRYEIEATWQSSEITQFVPTVTLPPGACTPGRVCRVRVRMKNAFGRWSHWSPPVEFVAGPPAQPPINTLKITEIMYHPPRRGFVQESDFEFIELKNIGATVVDLTGLRFTAGIDYKFESGATLSPGGFLVLAKNSQWFTYQHGFAPTGVYAKKLDDNTDRLTLSDVFSRTLFSVTYGDSVPWPPTTDGLGHSLVLNNPTQPDDPNSATSWRASLLLGGSPGADEPVPVVINEILPNPAAGQTVAIELHNPAAYEANIGGWYLADSPANALQYPIPQGVIIPPGGYLVLDEDDLRNAAPPFAYGADGGALYLHSARLPGRLSGYQHSVAFGSAPRGLSFGRYVNGAGQERFPLQSAPSLGQANAYPAIGPVVISKLMVSSATGLEYIELTNLTAEPVKLYDEARPTFTWGLTGVLYQLPTGVELPPHGRLVVTSLDPSRTCMEYEVDAAVRVLGPTPLPLLDSGQAIRLVRPLDTHGDGALHYVVADEVTYENKPPWPAATSSGYALERLTLTAYGDDPLTWRRSGRDNGPIRAATSGPVVELCSFDAYHRPDGSIEIQWVTHSESNVQGYNLWRSADGLRAGAELMTPTTLTAQSDPTHSGNYLVVDATALPGITYTYWLQAVSPAGESTDLLFTRPRAPIYHLYFPLVQR